ncbi:MAG TPA: hypothetical protein VJR27_01165 [Candidatus Saccharimonadales bacterium]|nr:hypothetical protein [Candidatus Saccharimonadales bacterium]
MSAEIKIIEKPPIIVKGVRHEPENGHIQGFQIGEKGVISFHPEAVNLPLRNIWIPMMASFGMANATIGEKLYRSEETIRTFIARDFRLLEMPARRRALPRRLFELAIFQVEEFGEKLNLTKSELPIIDLVSQGYTNKEVAAKISSGGERRLSPDTIKSHLTRIGNRTGWYGGEAGLAALVSGEIGSQIVRVTTKLSVPDFPEPASPLLPDQRPHFMTLEPDSFSV